MRAVRAIRTHAVLAMGALACCGLPSVDEFSRGTGAEVRDAAAEAPAYVEAGTDRAVVPAITIDPPVLETELEFDLSAEGALDWQAWSEPVNRCASCARWLGDLVVGGAPLQPYDDDERKFAWSNGAPRTTGSLTGGVYVGRLNGTMTVPVTVRDESAVVRLHTDVFHTAGVLSASFAGTEDGPSVSVPLGVEKYRFVVRIDGRPGSVVNIVWTVTGIDTSEPYANNALSAVTVSPP